MSKQRTYYWTLGYDTAQLHRGSLVTWYPKRRTLREVNELGVWYTESKRDCINECIKRNKEVKNG